MKKLLRTIRTRLNSWDSIISNIASPEREEITFSIANGNQESEEIDVGNASLVSLGLPGALDGTEFTLLGKYTSGGTYHTIMDQDGNDVVIPFTPDRKVSLNTTTLLGYQYVKVKSNMPQTAQRDFNAITKFIG